MKKSYSEAAKILSLVPSFTGMESSALEEIANITSRRTYSEEQIVFLEGDPCEGIYVVEKGWLKSVKISQTGREQVVRFVGPGEMFNELAVFTGGKNRITVQTLEPVTLWIIERYQLLELLDHHLALSRMVIENLSHRVLHLMRLVEDLSLRSVQSRLARLLCEREDKSDVHRRRWSTQAEMASHLGTVPDVLNRALRSLADEGLIEIDRHKIKIIDRQRLEEKAILK